MMGFEPTTLGTTNRCSNQLSYNHRVLGHKSNYFMVISKIKMNVFAKCRFNSPIHLLIQRSIPPLGYTFLTTSIISCLYYQIILLFPASVPYLAKDDSVLQGKGSFDPFGIFFNIICYRLDYICQVPPSQNDKWPQFAGTIC